MQRKLLVYGMLLASVVDPKLFFSDPDPDPTFQEISDPDPTQLLSKEVKAKF